MRDKAGEQSQGMSAEQMGECGTGLAFMHVSTISLALFWHKTKYVVPIRLGDTVFCKKEKMRAICETFFVLYLLSLFGYAENAKLPALRVLKN